MDLCTDYLVKRYDMAGGMVSPPCIVPTFATPRRLGMLFYAVMLQGALQLVFGPSFAYSLPVHPVHTRRDRVASLTNMPV